MICYFIFKQVFKFKTILLKNILTQERKEGGNKYTYQPSVLMESFN